MTLCGASALSEVTLSHVKHNHFWDIQFSPVSMTTTCVWGEIPWTVFVKLPLSKSFLVFSCYQKVLMLPHLVATNRQCLLLPAYRVYSLRLAGSPQLGTVTVPRYFQDQGKLC